jgi:methionine biosynthesis protein MetW
VKKVSGFGHPQDKGKLQRGSEGLPPKAEMILFGRAPVTKQLPLSWYDSPNIHFLSLKDFDQFCAKLGVKVEKKIPLSKARLSPVRFAPNLFAEQVIYVTSKD